MKGAAMTDRNDLNNPEEQDAAELYKLGTEALEAKNYASAQQYLSAALRSERSPDHLSQYALALAYNKRDAKTSISLCQEAIKQAPRNPEHFLRLGLIYLIARRRKDAIRVFRLGLRVGKHPTITRWLQVLGHREKPIIPFLSRSNPLNKYLGMMRGNLLKKK